MKLYITKPPPIQLILRGADSVSMWFDKPYFKPALSVCCVSGLLSPDERVPPHWSPQWKSPATTLKHLQRTQNTLFIKIWDDIMATYVAPDYDIIEKEYYASLRRLESTYYNTSRSDIDIFTNHKKDYLRKALHASACESIEQEACRACEKEGMAWYEWIGEYEIEMTLK